MLTHKLEKNVILYKNQFEKFALDIFGDHRLDRYSLELDGILFRIKYMYKHNKDTSHIESLRNDFTNKTIQIRNAFSEFTFNLITQIIGINDPFKLDDIVDVLAQDVEMDPTYVKFKMIVISSNKNFLNYIDNSFEDENVWNIFPNEYFRFYTDSYNDGISKAFPELFENRQQTELGTGDDHDVFVHNFTFQTSEKCSLNCFTAGTKILMADLSEKNIEDIKFGDEVLGFAEFKTQHEYSLFSKTYVTSPLVAREAKVYKLTCEKAKPLIVTAEHPMLTWDHKWKQVKDLKPGDVLSRVKVVKENGKKNNGVISVLSRVLSIEELSEPQMVYNFETFKHTYIANNIKTHNCLYCYQFNKSNMRMDFETAKEFIDNLLADKYGYINRYNSPAIIIEFIGGEPLLEINLTRKIYEYFLEQCYELNHPWFTLHRISICSNGLQYFDDEVQSFFKDYASQISFNISIDGNKELHDSCRIQPNGEGSYDICIAALDHYNKHYSKERNSKMTLAPENISYLYDSVINFINNGMSSINLNCVFEEGWNQKTANIEYYQLKKLTDYIVDNNLEHIYLSIFNERQEDKYDKSYDGSFCFKAGTSLMTINGNTAIENIKTGDLVYTASGNINKVVRTHSHISTDNKVLRVSGAFPIHCTSDHKVFAKKFLYIGWKGVIHYSEPDFYPVSELKKGDRIALPLLDLSKNKPNWIDKKMAYVLGVFIADGFINHRDKKIVFTPGYDEDKYYFNILKDAGFKFSSYERRTSISYSLSRSACVRNEMLYKLCEACGHLAHNKHFPRIIFESPIDIIKECIRGYCDTDGYTVTRGSFKNIIGLIKTNSASPWLMNDLLLLLRSIGEYPTCYYYPRAGTMKIEDRIVNVRDRYEVYYNPKNRNANNLFKKDETFNVLWSGIHMIEDDPEEYEVYCPTVYPLNDSLIEEHSLIVNGMAALNCGGDGAMLALRPNGQFYPCIRYMPTSVGNNVKDLCLGDVKTGMVGRDQGSEVLKLLDKITRRGQNNDICYECPLSNDCASCLALGHTVFGDPNKRTTFTCIQMIAEHLANVYYWNRIIIKHPEWDLYVRKNVCPDEWSLLVIDKKELEELKLLECSAMIKRMEYKNKEMG